MSNCDAIINGSGAVALAQVGSGVHYFRSWKGWVI
jgi:hypothetical protein